MYAEHCNKHGIDYVADMLCPMCLAGYEHKEKRGMHLLKLYVPDIDSDKGRQVLNSTVKALTLQYGGVTAYEAEGTWLNSFNVLCYESTYVVEVLIKKHPQYMIQNFVTALAHTIKVELEQECVLWVLQPLDPTWVAFYGK